MSNRNRLTIISTVVFGIVFTVSAVAVYFIFSLSTERVIYDELRKTSELAALFYLEEDEVSSKEFEEIRKAYYAVLQEDLEIVLYNKYNQLAFGEVGGDDAITEDVLNRIRNNGIEKFKHDNRYYLGLFYEDNQGSFVVITSERNVFFQEQLNLLIGVLLIVFLLGIVLIFLFSRIISNLAYKPVKQVIDELNSYDFEKSNHRLTSLNSKDEIQELVDNFNKLLERISDMLKVHKNFINYVSHEIKTPLTSISGNIEVFALKERSENETELVVNQIKNNVHEINDILNSLLELSGLREQKTELFYIRIDELVWEILTARFSKQLNRIKVHIEISAEEHEYLKVLASKKHLKMAVTNVLENSLKFSSKDVVVTFYISDNRLCLSIEDFGVGIKSEEVNKIKQPFFRGENAEYAAGTGIGLTVSDLICKKNNIDLIVNSQPHIGTTVYFLFRS